MNQNQPTTNERVELTSKSLGIADKRQADLAGLVLSPQEISESIIIMLMKCGVPRDAIHSVRIGRDKEGLEITARVEEEAVKSTVKIEGNRPQSWIGISERATKLKIRPEIYNGLRNKAFVKNLHFQKEKIKGDDYVNLNFDADVLLAFIYNINYADEYLKVSPIEFNSSKKQKKKLGYTPCGAIITYSTGKGGFSVNQVMEMHDED